MTDYKKASEHQQAFMLKLFCKPRHFLIRYPHDSHYSDLHPLLDAGPGQEEESPRPLVPLLEVDSVRVVSEAGPVLLVNQSEVSIQVT